LNDSAPTIFCLQCNQSISARANFCPNCGKPLIPSEKARPAFQFPETGYAIEFADSTATNFPTVLEKAKQSFRYETCVKGRTTWHLAVFNGDQFLLVMELAKSLDGNKKRKIYINGKEERWRDVFAFMFCTSIRKYSNNPKAYCFGVDDRQINLWGCKQLSMGWNDWSDWFAYGSLQKSSEGTNLYVWTFDKEKILHELNSKLFTYRFCPHINTNLIQAILELLPNKVEVSPSTEDWRFRTGAETVPGNVTIHEQHGERGAGVSWSATYSVFGVEPHGNQLARKILQEAFNRCGMQEPKIDDLLK
jgi:predicted RNA-binding Zn-ribbon protein involved in translation (DUF1610 family)